LRSRHPIRYKQGAEFASAAERESPMAGIASVVLIIHIMVAVAMIAVILLQRSEGGALGIGGGSGAFMSARSAGNVLTRTTTILVTIFFITSMLLTVLGRHAGPKSLNLGTPAKTGTITAPEPAKPVAPAATLPQLPDSSPASAPATEPPANAPASAAPSEAAPSAPAPQPAKPAPASH
jgi:preprotein translocase subunit SecG